MFLTAILIGVYSYLIFGLGLVSLLYKESVIFVSLLYFTVIVLFYKKRLFNFLKYLKLFKQKNILETLRKNRFVGVLIGLILLQIAVNLIGVLGPELSFDALWYHLTLPKIYLQNHTITYIPGNLFYYSVMPKLTEMLYIPSLVFGNEILAKAIHFSFGILCCFSIYKLSKKFFSTTISLIAVVIFYSNLVVGWESITAYVDLARTFFETLALISFISWFEKDNKKMFFLSAVMTGFAIATKLLALGSLAIFVIIIALYFFFTKKSIKKMFAYPLLYLIISLLIPLPWFTFSYINTGNPVYPFFTKLLSVGFEQNVLNPVKFISDIFFLFTKSSDPISPLYIIFFPLVLVFIKKLRFELKVIFFYSVLSIIIWYLTSRIGGGRFVLPYLPAFSVIIVAIINEVWKIKTMKFICVSLIIITSVISIFYRGVANKKYIPVVLGIESKNEFLTNNLNFSFADFYDTDEYFKNHIKQSDRILLYGFHNLYYANFNFIDSSMVKEKDTFNYVAVQSSKIPDRFRNWTLVYKNSKTGVRLYSLDGNMSYY